MADARFRWGAWAGAMGLALVAAPAAAQSQPAQVTFTKDVAPIFQKACESCHRKDSLAPMSLVTYEEARPWARSIKARVASRQMPPWHIDRSLGIQHFQNDRSLTDEQVATIVKWVDSGAPKGNMQDMPPPVQWPSEEVWNFASMFGEPDLIIKTPQWKQPAIGQDAWYKPVVESGLTEPRWVRAIEIRPGTLQGRRITHHALAHLQQEEPGVTDAASREDSGAGLFMEWAVGKQGEIMRENSGKLLLPGSRFVFDIHYHSVGEDITDNVELGIYLYPKGQEPKYRQTLALYSSIQGGNRNLDIPPNSVVVTQNFHVMRKSGRMENFQPHMHLRGKAMSVEAILPSGETQMINMVSEYDFQWMSNYVYADDVAPLLPKGTILRVTSWYDNTTANKDNPDPNQWVGWGDRTVDEMGHAWINITYMDEEDFKAEVDKRKAMTSTTSADRQQ
ncbi:MAG: cytochrome c [Acidobacteriota bacterium]|nr:cytochrome c [Acidobacteriota bacterium]